MVHFFVSNRIKKKTFIILVMSIQFMMWGSIGLNYLNLGIPLLRQIIGFIYLSFIPGLIFLRILNVKNTDFIYYILYSIGLSITLIMLLGYFLNIIGPVLGNNHPLSLYNLITCISFFVMFLISYIWKFEPETNYYASEIHLFGPFSPKLLLFLIPLFLSAIGSWYANSFGNCILLVIFATTIPFYVLFAIFFHNKLQIDFFPIIIYVLSLSLLLHYSLISRYLFGYDINYEYYTFETVANNLIWNSKDPAFSTNSLLSVTILPTVYHHFLNIDGTWVYKIIFQIIFAFVPVALYQMYKSQTIKWVAFLSVFFFISQITFFTEMTMLARQEIAELFLILVILISLNININSFQRKILLILFSISIVISHYGISYIYLIFLFTMLIIRHINNKYIFKTVSNNVMTLQFFILIFIFCTSWYIYHSYSSAFNNIIELSYQIVKAVINDLFPSPYYGSVSSYKDPVISTALGSNPVGVSKLHLAHIYVKRFTFLFIIVGFLEYIVSYFIMNISLINLFQSKISTKLQQNYMLKYIIGFYIGFVKRSILKPDRHEAQFDATYAYFSIVSFIFLFMTIILPVVSASWNMTRIFHISLFLLSPFAIFGCLRVISLIPDLFKFNLNYNFVSSLTILFFIIYFVFEVGLMNVYFGEPSSVALDRNHQDVISLNGALIHEQEVYSAKWLSCKREISNNLYAESMANQHVLTSYGHIFSNQRDILNVEKIPINSYIYMRYINTVYKIIPSFYGKWVSKSIYDAIPELPTQNRIYSNGGSEIYLTSENMYFNRFSQ